MPPFLTKLFDILSNGRSSAYITWNSGGRAVLVRSELRGQQATALKYVIRELGSKEDSEKREKLEEESRIRRLELMEELALPVPRLPLQNVLLFSPAFWCFW